MVDTAPRERVTVAVTRSTTRGPELLVFEHRDFPEAGTQLPGGGVEAGETLEEAAAREVAEETGLTGIAVSARVGAHDDPTAAGRAQHTVAVHATTTASADRWEHVVEGDGDDTGLVFLCSFIPLREAVRRLARRDGELVPALISALGPPHATTPRTGRPTPTPPDAPRPR